MGTPSSIKFQEEREWSFLGRASFHAFHFRHIYQQLWARGHHVSPRGQKVLELENFHFDLPPYVRFTNFKCRNFNLGYVKKELLWYLRGDRFDTSIADEAKMWKDLINEDGSIDSNYGQYIFKTPYGGVAQFDRVVSTLVADEDSRRAVITILHSMHLAGKSKDIPCTYSIGFRIREQALNMTVRMRSNDAIFGMSNDVPFFSLIHEMMLNALREFYPALEYGNYHHSADSMHVYERHFGMLDNLVCREGVDDPDSPGYYTLVKCPKISGPDEVRFLREGKFIFIPEEFQYSRWLKEA